MSAVIEAKGLTKSYRGRTVVDRLDLSVPEGAVCALLGDNGAGKSTTMRLLTGLVPADAGRATILGRDCWADALELRHAVGYVPERPRFYDWMTVREIGHFTAGFHRPGYAARYGELLGRLGLEPGAKLSTLSKGGYARVGLGLALASDPRVLLLDEPTSGLDLFTRREFLTSMVDLAAEGRTILISSHGVAELERVASHAVFLARGELLLAGTLDELRRRLSELRVRHDGSLPGPAGLGTVLDVEASGGEWRAVLLDAGADAVAGLRHRPGVLSVDKAALSLEEMYTALLARFHRRPAAAAAEPALVAAEKGGGA